MDSKNTCKIYKGIDTPCKIKGMLYRYFYMMFAVYGLAGLILLLDFSGATQSGKYTSFIIEAIATGVGVLAIRIYFTKKSQKKKITDSNKRVYISVRNMYKSLKSK